MDNLFWILMCVNFALISSKAGEVCFPFGAVQDGDDSLLNQIQGRPGKTGPRGPPGPAGSPAICKFGDELAQLQDEVAQLKKVAQALDFTKIDECGAGVRAYPGGIIPDNQMTSSTNWSNQYLPHHGRLDLRNVTRSAWIPSGYNMNDWLQVDFSRPKFLTGIVTQGRDDLTDGMQYPTSFKVSYGNSTTQLLVFRESNGREKIFQGNYNHLDYVINYFPRPITARYVRFLTHSWRLHSAVRLEYLTC